MKIILTSGLLCVLLKLSRVSRFKYKRKSDTKLRSNIRLPPSIVKIVEKCDISFFLYDITHQKQSFGINTVPSAVERSALQANLCLFTHQSQLYKKSYYNKG